MRALILSGFIINELYSIALPDDSIDSDSLCSFCSHTHTHTHTVSGFAFRYAVDMVVCVALGVDMFDCVFPTRTAVGMPDLRTHTHTHTYTHAHAHLCQCTADACSSLDVCRSTIPK